MYHEVPMILDKLGIDYSQDFTTSENNKELN